LKPIDVFGTETELRRDLGRATAIAVVIGTVVGSGIFIAPSLVLGRVGSPVIAVAVWLVSGLCALCGILCYAELSAMMPRSGGPFVYLRMAFPPWVAFLFGWTSFFVLQPSALALISDVLVTHAAHLAGVADGFAPWTRKGLQAGIIVFLAAANYRGVRVGGFIQLLFTILKVVGLAAIIFAGLALGDASASTTLPRASGLGAVVAFGAAMIAAMQAHYGFENATFVAEEIRDPRRNLPIALVAGMLAVIALYLLVNLALFSALSHDELVTSESPTALAMERTLGIAGGTVLAAIVVFSTFGSLNGAMLASPRLFYAMGKAGLFFRFTTRVHSRFKTPHLSIVALTVVALAYVAGLGTWERVTEAVSVAFAAFLSLAVIALFVLRKKFPDVARPYRVTGYPLTPLLYLGIILAYTVTIVASNPQTTLIGIAIAAAGLVFYPLFARAS
jgi:amino acid transporter